MLPGLGSAAGATGVWAEACVANATINVTLARAESHWRPADCGTWNQSPRRAVGARDMRPLNSYRVAPESIRRGSRVHKEVVSAKSHKESVRTAVASRCRAVAWGDGGAKRPPVNRCWPSSRRQKKRSPAHLHRRRARCRQDRTRCRGCTCVRARWHRCSRGLRRDLRSGRYRSAVQAIWKSFPDASIEYRGVVLEEMDVEAIIRPQPQLCMVDELAHTQRPGQKHEKRYQDVTELLDAGSA